MIMNHIKILLCLLLLFCCNRAFAGEKIDKDYIVLLHGLGRTEKSFDKMENYLRKQGYCVLNIDYPSRAYDIQNLTEKFIKKEVEAFCTDKNKKINFVTHSLGGIIVRYYLKKYRMDNLGRVVMLSPPNQGSEIVDSLKDHRFIKEIFGPAFDQLSTKPSSFINALGAADFEFGVITGDKSINWINSWIIPGADDGKVSVERSKMKNMKDFLVVKQAHPFIMDADEVMTAVVNFLQTGRFSIPF